MGRKDEEFPELNALELHELKQWLSENEARLPAAVVRAITMTLRLAEKLGETRRKSRNIIRELMRAMGIAPSSERRRSQIAERIRQAAGRGRAETTRSGRETDF